MLEANEQYWRKAPSVKRLVFKSVPDEATRLAMLKRGEADIAYSIRGALAEELAAHAGAHAQAELSAGHVLARLRRAVDDPKSPWADRRVRLAANLAIDRQAINQAETLGFSKITGSIIPHTFEVFWPPPAPVRTIRRRPSSSSPRRATRTASMPATTICDASYANLGEAVVNYLRAAGIRTQLRPLERAAFIAQNSQKKLKNVIQTASGASGNAATRLDAFVAAGGTFTYGSYPDIEGLVREQAGESDAEAAGGDPAPRSSR